MKKKTKSTRGIWLGLIGLFVGLALGYFGSGFLSQWSLLGSSNKLESEYHSDPAAAMLKLQVERTDTLDQQIQEKMKDLEAKRENGSVSQEDMIKLQSLMSKRNQAMEQTTNLMKKHNEALETIVRDME